MMEVEVCPNMESGSPFMAQYLAVTSFGRMALVWWKRLFVIAAAQLMGVLKQDSSNGRHTSKFLSFDFVVCVRVPQQETISFLADQDSAQCASFAICA
jgi:hypothetical protein